MTDWKAGNELDRLVAERVLGWRQGVNPEDCRTPVWIKPSGELHPGELPRFSEDDDAARWMLKQLESAGVHVCDWQVIGEPSIVEIRWPEKDSDPYGATGDTFALAACRAAVKVAASGNLPCLR